MADPEYARVYKAERERIDRIDQAVRRRETT